MTDATRNCGPIAGRNTDGTFAEGNSGRPHGTRTRATGAAEALLDGESEGLTRKAIENLPLAATQRLPPEAVESTETAALPTLGVEGQMLMNIAQWHIREIALTAAIGIKPDI